MTRPMRILRNFVIAFLGVILTLVIAVAVVVHTGWFQNYVRQTIIAKVENSTGGKVQIGMCHLDLTRLSAVLTDFVIHGTEPAGAAPLLSIHRIQLNFRLFPSLDRLWDITYLGIDQPQANVIVYSDGHTNIPSPRQTSNSSPLQTVVDLAIGRFELTNGLVVLADQKQQLDLRGNNLRAHLLYNNAQQDYQGALSLQPVYVASGGNTPVNFTVNVPVVFSRNGIDMSNASIFSSNSAITISALIHNLKNPNISAHATGHIALADLKDLTHLPLSLNARNTPSVVDLNATMSETNHTVQISGLHLSLGRSDLEASGNLNAGIAFTSHLALAQLGSLVNKPSLPNNVATLAGTAKFIQNNLTVTGLRASALGGEFTGAASFNDFSAYQVRGDLKHLDLASATRVAGQPNLPYQGTLSGPISVTGNVKTGLRSLMARAALSINPNGSGIPLSGNLKANFDGTNENISIQNSVLTLPHSRVTVDGSLGKKLNVALTTTNLDDLFGAIPPSYRPPINLPRGGQARFAGEVNGSLSTPHIFGDFTATRLSIEGRQFDTFKADLAVDKSGITIRNGSLDRDRMQAQFSGTLGLQDWKPAPSSPLAINVTMQNGELPDVLALAGQPSNGSSGQLNADAHIGGTFGNPSGSGSLVVINGAIHGQSFDRAEAQVDLTDQLITVPTAFVQLGPARVNFTAQFHHPRDSLTRGQIQGSIQSSQMNLAQLTALQKERPNTSGVVQIQASVSGNLGAQFQLTSVNGNLAVRGLRSEGQNYGDLRAVVATVGQTVNYNLTSDFAGSNIVINGNTQLAHDYPTTARASLANLPTQRVLAVAGRSNIPIKGLLSGTANFSGTIANPQGSADLVLANASIYDDALNRVQARVIYQPQSIDLPQLELVSGPSRLDLSARYAHPVGNLESGSLQFQVNSSRIELARIKTLAAKRPGLAGNLQLNFSGAAQVRKTGTPVALEDLNGNLSASDLAVSGKKLGSLNVAANTSRGQVAVVVNSNLAGASITGQGNLQLANDYLTDARLTFHNVTWAGLRPLVAPGFGEGQGLEAVTDGQLSMSGPLSNVDQLRGSAQVTRLELSGAPSVFQNNQHVLLQNQGPLTATVDRGAIKIQNAHLTGLQTNFQATGTIPLNGRGMDVALNGNMNLAIAQNIDPLITSSGSIVLDAGIHGSFRRPRLTGQVQLNNASFDRPNLPVGIWHANATIALSGDSAVIRTFSAQSGGGQVTATGSATFSNALRFGVQAKAVRVRLLVQQGVGVVASANLSLTGTIGSSLLSGTVTMDEVTYATQSDLGSLLSLAAPPVEAPPVPSAFLQNMRIDVRVRSSSALGLQASVAQNLQLSADLRVRGTAANPGVLGRVLITEGKLRFFGSTYTVNVGAISFYNPVRIEPVLDLSLETSTQGVNVVIKVTGPIDNMKLSYTSDPPLPFQQIVSLLATGTAPTSDPTLLANQPALPPQTFQQLGESAIVGQAVANPVTNQLQRVFGITELRINPAFTSGSQLPQTQVTLQQQISSNLTFTYVTGLNTANAQTVQVQWTFTPQWSAQALRDYNGIFSVTLLYKKQLR